jgi:hypothetical protein
MPSTEELILRANSNTVPLAIQGLKVFWIFVCPVCDRYTIHEPRLNPSGHWMVDHCRERVFQTDFTGPKKYVGMAPTESCFVDDNTAIANIEYTRTVIRVK